MSDNAKTARGSLRLRNEVGSNLWSVNGVLYRDSGAGVAVGGLVDLGGTLDGVRITVSAANTFDAGTVSITYR